MLIDTYLNTLPKLITINNECIAKINMETGAIEDYPDLFPDNPELVVMTKKDYLTLCFKLNDSLKKG
jgi:hypothetical protein